MTLRKAKFLKAILSLVFDVDILPADSEVMEKYIQDWGGDYADWHLDKYVKDNDYSLLISSKQTL